MVHTTIDRLAVKTLDQRFRYELETGFELAPRISQGILELAKEIFRLDTVSVGRPDSLRPGQIRQVIAAAEAPHGSPLRQTSMVEVIWTLDAGEEDLQVLQKQGRVALRQVRLLRLIDEALDQGGVPTQEDLARVLGVCVRTIRSDIATLKAKDYQIVTRGQLQGAGRGQTHKVQIVELYLKPVPIARSCARPAILLGPSNAICRPLLGSGILGSLPALRHPRLSNSLGRNRADDQRRCPTDNTSLKKGGGNERHSLPFDHPAYLSASGHSSVGKRVQTGGKSQGIADDC